MDSLQFPFPFGNSGYQSMKKLGRGERENCADVAHCFAPDCLDEF
jgi:hypothetical protein